MSEESKETSAERQQPEYNFGEEPDYRGTTWERRAKAMETLRRLCGFPFPLEF